MNCSKTAQSANLLIFMKKSRIKLKIYQYFLLFKQIFKFFPCQLPLGVRFYRSGISRFETIADIGPGFVIHELCLLFPALVMDRLGIKPAIQAAMQSRPAFRAHVLPADFQILGCIETAMVAFHDLFVSQYWNGLSSNVSSVLLIGKRRASS